MNICPSRTKFLGWEGVPVQDVSLLVFARLPVAPKAKVEAANPATGGKNPCGTLAKVGKPFEANFLICWELVKGEVLAALVRTLGGGQAVVHHAPVGHGLTDKKIGIVLYRGLHDTICRSQPGTNDEITIILILF